MLLKGCLQGCITGQYCLEHPTLLCGGVLLLLSHAHLHAEQQPSMVISWCALSQLLSSIRVARLKVTVTCERGLLRDHICNFAISSCFMQNCDTCPTQQSHSLLHLTAVLCCPAFVVEGTQALSKQHLPTTRPPGASTTCLLLQAVQRQNPTSDSANVRSTFLAGRLASASHLFAVTEKLACQLFSAAGKTITAAVDGELAESMTAYAISPPAWPGAAARSGQELYP